MWFINRRPSLSSLSSLFSSSTQEAPTLTQLSRQIRQALKPSHSRPINPNLRNEFSAWLDADVGTYDLGKTHAVDKYVNLHPGLQREVRMIIDSLYALTVEKEDEIEDDFEFEIATRIARLRALHAPGRRRSSSVQSFGSLSSMSSVESP